MNRRLTDPTQLRRRLDQLRELRQTHGLTAMTLEALAECSFRLAVHPQTPPHEALKLLRQAAGLDPGNPKYPYHIARLYFVHGEFDPAAEWLRVAAVRCPTSHRIWAHVALLHRELSARYERNDAYDGAALLERAAQITAGIQGGQDEFGAGLLTFVPPPSQKTLKAAEPGSGPPPRPAVETEPFPEGIERLTDPRQCRWGGVADLEMERHYQVEANKTTLQELLPSLEAAGRAAAGRPDLRSAFIVLAIQWLLAGFPPGSVRRLCPVPLPPASPAPELELLDLAIGAFEAPPEQVPLLLAEAMDRGRIPPTLAAIIHHHRLLARRPLDFEPAAKIGAVRRFLEAVRTADPEVPDGDKLDTAVRKYRDTLSAARKALRIVPKQPLEDVAPAAGAVPFDAARARQQLDRLREDAARLKEVKNQLVTHILERIEAPLKAASDLAACARAAGDRPAVERIRDEVKQNGATGQARLDELKKRAADLPGAELGADFVTGCATCEKDLRDARNIGNIAGMLKRVDLAAEAAHRQLGFEPGPVSPECQAMAAGVSGLFTEAPPGAESPTNEPGQSPPSASRAEQTAALATRARELRAEVNQHLELLAALEGAHKDGQLGSRGRDDLRGVAAFAERFPAECDTGIKEGDAIRSSGELTTADAIGQLDAALKDFRAVLPFKKTFRDRLKKLPVPGPESPPAPVEGTLAANAEAAAAPAGAPTPGVGSALAGLQADLAVIESELSAFYAGCLGEFAVYSQRSRSEPALAELIATVRRFEAETLYRLGRRRAARAIWNGLLRDNRLDPDLLHKLAVADSHDLDPAPGLASWRAYAEVLYFRDVVAGTPRPGARRRAELHRHLAGAYGPPGLTPRREQQQPEPDPDPEVIVAFLNDPGRVRCFVGHKLLEFAAARFDYTSPPILLGVSRGDGAATREAARQRWGTFLDQIAPMLPDRIRGAFAGTCQRHLDAALEACGSASRLVRRNDPHYDEEQKRHVRWLAEVVELKARLRGWILQAENLNSSLTSIGFLDELVRLDRVPLDTSPDWILDAARSVFQPDDLAKVVPDLPNWFATTRDPVLLAMVVHVFQGPDSEASRREVLYQKLIGPWLRHEALWKPSPQAGDRSYADLLDDPSPFYPEAILTSLKAESPGGRAISLLREWCQRYPRSTGPARYLASLLIKSGKFDDAGPVLDAAIAAAFHDGGRAESESLKRHLRHLELAKVLKRAQAGVLEAADELLQALQADDGDPAIAQQVINGFFILAKAAVKDPGADRLSVAVESWVGLARRKLGSEGAEIDAVRADRDKALVMIALAAGGGHTRSPDWKRIIAGMTDLMRRHPDLKEPYYWRMKAYWQLAVTASKQKDGAAVRRHAASARDDATQVVSQLRETEMAEEASQILEQARALD
jgi:tetratricopeptide (TPR) repeat protein